MVDDEIDICLSGGDRFTLADFMRLRNIHSPYIFGGSVTLKDIEAAAAELDMETDGVDAFLRRQMAACNRAFEIIQAPHQQAKFHSETPVLGPEWMTDIMAAAASACPALTPDDMLHATPLVLLIHLAGAAHRRNGGITRRPSDDAAAIRLLQSFHQSK